MSDIAPRQISVYQLHDFKQVSQIPLAEHLSQASLPTPKSITKNLQQSLTLYLNSRRQATAHTKTRAEVSGGGKKPWAQKGTGRARQGSTRSPQWRHGGIVFGPRNNRNYTIQQNRQVHHQVYNFVVDQILHNAQYFVLRIPQTTPCLKDLTKWLKHEKIYGKKILFLDESFNHELARNFHNLANFIYLDIHQACVYQLVNAEIYLFTEALWNKFNAQPTT